MSEPTHQQSSAPIPGWYEDPQHGFLRWWDGSGWTDHVQMPGASPPAAAPAPAEPVASGGGRYLVWVLAMVAALALSVVAVVIVAGAGGGDDPGPTDVLPSEQATDAQTAARSAQTAIETFAVDHNGTYEGATVDELVQIEPTLSGAALQVSGQSGGYTITATASGESAFSITRTSDGAVAFICTPPGTGACGDAGTW